MSNPQTTTAPETIDDFADLRRPADCRPTGFLVATLFAAIVIASTTIHLMGLEASASIILN